MYRSLPQPWRCAFDGAIALSPVIARAGSTKASAAMSWYGSSGYQPPGNLPITEPERDRSIRYLQEAFSQGRLSRDEFDTRIAKVLVATTRRELSDAFAGLVRVPLAAQAIGSHPVYSPFPNMDADGRAGRVMGAVAHWSADFTWLFGPGIMYSLAKPDTFAQYEAAKAFNFNLQATVVAVALGLVAHFTGWGFLLVIWVILALVLNVVGGIEAARGQSWRNPIGRVLPLRVLNEGTGQRAALER